MLIQADAMRLPLQDECVQAIVTSPPYWGLRDYGGGSLELGREPLHDCGAHVSGMACGECYVCSMVRAGREMRRVLKPDGVLWLNIGDTYSASGAGVAGKHGWMGGERKARKPPEGLKRKELAGMPWRVALALQADGWWLRSSVVWHKPNALPSPVRDRCTSSHEMVFMLARAEHYYFNPDANREQAAGAKTRNRRDVWSVAVGRFSGAHFATMPKRLVAPCISTTTRRGDIVMDPFAGSGTVGEVAEEMGRKALLFDISRNYLTNCARARLTSIQRTMAI